MKYFHKDYLKKILSIIYYEYLPECIKKHLSSTRFFIKFLILSRINHLYLSIFLLYGKEKKLGSDLKILLIGDEQTLSYFSNILYSEEPNIKNIGSTFIWNSKNYVRFFLKDVDAVILKTDKFFSGFLRKKGFIIIPEWIIMELDISGSYDNIYKNFKTSAKRDIHNIKKYEYTYEITNDYKKFEFFYNELYLPFISNRYDQAILSEGTDYQDIKNIFEKGKLLLIKKKDKYVSGIIFKTKNNFAFPIYLGVTLDSQYPIKGACAANYYFFINWAKENGFKYLGFGDVRAFLNDGLFRYKRKWGMSVKISKYRLGIIGFKINNFKSKALNDFLENNPFIYSINNSLIGLLFIRNTVSPKEFKKINDNFFTPGLTTLSVINLQKIEEEIKKI